MSKFRQRADQWGYLPLAFLVNFNISGIATRALVGDKSLTLIDLCEPGFERQRQQSSSCLRMG